MVEKPKVLDLSQIDRKRLFSPVSVGQNVNDREREECLDQEEGDKENIQPQKEDTNLGYISFVPLSADLDEPDTDVDKSSKVRKSDGSRQESKRVKAAVIVKKDDGRVGRGNRMAAVAQRWKAEPVVKKARCGPKADDKVTGKVQGAGQRTQRNKQG